MGNTACCDCCCGLTTHLGCNRSLLATFLGNPSVHDIVASSQFMLSMRCVSAPPRLGCTNSGASNFDSSVVNDDGSCDSARQLGSSSSSFLFEGKRFAAQCAVIHAARRELFSLPILPAVHFVLCLVSLSVCAYCVAHRRVQGGEHHAPRACPAPQPEQESHSCASGVGAAAWCRRTVAGYAHSERALPSS